MRGLMMAAVLMVGAGCAGPKAVDQNARMRALSDAIRSDGYGIHLAGVCRAISPAEVESVMTRMVTEVRTSLGPTAPMFEMLFVMGATQARAALRADRGKACGLLTPDAVRRAHDLAAGRAHILDSLEPGATTGRINVPAP